MKKFEYKVIARVVSSELNLLGEEGWELLHIQRDDSNGKHWFYLKREKQ